MIEVSGLRKRFGRTVALDGIDLHVGAGELVGLVGHNGAGKSTLLEILAGQLLPSEGTTRIDGIDVQADPNGARARLGFVPEDPALYDYLSAREFLELVVAVRGRGDVDRALEQTGLGTEADRLIREYSQGMRRKTALAAAIVATPPTLVLDEALNGLDPPSAARMFATLEELRAGGAAILLSTHVLDTIARAATRVVMLSRGTVVLDEPIGARDGSDLEALFLQVGRPA